MHIFLLFFLYLYAHYLCISDLNMDLLRKFMELQPYWFFPLFLSRPGNVYGSEQCHMLTLTLCFERRAVCLPKHIYKLIVQSVFCLKFSYMLRNLYYHLWCHRLQFFITRDFILPVPTQQNRDLSI